MIDERIVRAARNNADWCELVCSSQGTAGEFHEDIWITRGTVPRFYPNAVTLTEIGVEQLPSIAGLAASRPSPGWCVKDSWAALDLAGKRFSVLFDAEWIYLAPAHRLHDSKWPATDARVAAETLTWSVARTDRELADWESAWNGYQTATADGARVFLPALLDCKEVAFIAARREDQIVAGAIANRSAEVVGWSNFFTARGQSALDCAAASLAEIRQIFSGAPVVGYASGPALRGAQALGFESMGPLRIWIFSG
jgi:hypothetical protein